MNCPGQENIQRQKIDQWLLQVMGNIANRCWVTFRDENILDVVMHTQSHNYTKNTSMYNLNDEFYGVWNISQFF
jgi:hypothetical protein